MAWTSLSCTRLSLSKSILHKTLRTAYLAPPGLTSTPLQNCVLFSHFHRKSKSNIVGQSFILVQDGSDFQELPVILRRLTSEDSINLLGASEPKNSSTENSKDELTDLPEETEEASAIIDGFNKCYSPKGIFALLDIIPSDEVTPYVALKALQQIIKLENNKEFRNNVQCHQNVDVDEEDTVKNFTRIAVFTQLVNTLITSDDSSILLNGLKLVSRDVIGRKCEEYKLKLCEEVLCRVTDGKFSIEQTCEAVKVFSMLGDRQGLEKLWVGIVDKSKDINEANILKVFRCLPHFGNSRKLIMSHLEKKTLIYWWKLSSRDIAEILFIFKENKISSNRILGILSRWINTNIHAVNEEDLLNIVNGFRALEFSNQGIDKALERYVRAKSIRIQNPLLMKSISDYCLQFRMRSPSLLQGTAEFLVLKGHELSPIALKSIFTSFGLLDYRPTNGLQFWQVFESVFEQKFVQFRPDDALDVLMACIYLEKYPLNFVAKVFNPNFLDRIHYSQNNNAIQLMRSKLKLLDAAMTLECSLYDGPLLPKDKLAKGVWIDNRIKRLLNFISDNMNDVFGSMSKISLFNVLPQLPLNDIYVIDALVYPNNLSLAMNVFRDFKILTAVLVMLPEYYCTDGSLIGPQVMRKRHLKKLGFKLVTLDYSMLARLRVHPKELNEYLNERLKVAEEEAKSDSRKSL